MDNQQLILIPLIAQVFLVFLVWIWMYKTRITEIRKKSINPQLLANSSDAMENLKDVSGPSDNFKNLFEIPVLFYIAIIVIYVTKIASILYFSLATTFVILRYVHSFIHVTYNRVIHRFIIYILSSVTLWVIWILICIDLIYI